MGASRPDAPGAATQWQHPKETMAGQRREAGTSPAAAERQAALAKPARGHEPNDIAQPGTPEAATQRQLPEVTKSGQDNHRGAKKLWPSTTIPKDNAQTGAPEAAAQRLPRKDKGKGTSPAAAEQGPPEAKPGPPLFVCSFVQISVLHHLF